MFFHGSKRKIHHRKHQDIVTLLQKISVLTKIEVTVLEIGYAWGNLL